jgi:hypothetical protein
MIRSAVISIAFASIFIGCGGSETPQVDESSTQSEETTRAVTSSNNGCWKVEDKASVGYAELDDKIEFHFRDDTTCQKIANARVTFAGVTKKTNFSGRVEFPASLIEDMMDDRVEFLVTKNGYVTYQTELGVFTGSIWKHRFLLSKSLKPDQVKFVLEWSKNPRDLDLHFKTDNYHIFYGNKNNSGGQANLDVDDVSSYGPETILVQKIDSSKRYELFVNVFSPSNERIRGQNRATVSVYKDEVLDRVIELKNESSRKIDILTVDNGDITYLK